MDDQDKSKEQLIRELAALRHQLAASQNGASRSNVEQSLRESEAELRQVMASVSDYLWSATVAPDGRFAYRYYSPVVETITGYPPEFFMEDPSRWLSTIHPEDRPTLEAALGRITSGKSLHEAEEYRTVRTDGTVRWLRDSVLVERQPDGSLLLHGVVSDITERKNAEITLRTAHAQLEKRVRRRTAELAEANRKLTATLESITDGFVAFDHQWRYTYVNEAATRFLGKSRDELLGRVLWEVFPDTEKTGFHAAFHRAVDEQTVAHVEDFYPEPLNRWYECHCYPSSEGMSLFFRDITQRKQTEEAIVRAKQQWEQTFDSVPDLIAIMDTHFRIVRVNRPMAQRLGRTPEECVGMTCYKGIHGELEPPVFCPHARTLATGEEHREEVHEERLGGYFMVTTTPLFDQQGKLFGSVHVARDITQRKLAEEQLRRERHGLAHLLRASDHERQLIAYEVHDGLAQHLAGAIMQLENCGHLLQEHPDKAHAAFDAGMQMVRKAHAEARRLISGVRPPVLDESGIRTAIAYLIHEQQSSEGPEIGLACSIAFERLPATLENAIYRIAQEALSNACTHSRSEKVQVSLVQEADRLRLEVRDWGIGFDPQAVPEDRYGLEGIRERTRLLGGQLHIDTGADRGTLIRVVLPLWREGDSPVSQFG